MIRTDNLTKVFKSNKKEINAVNKLNIECKDGEIYSLLGANGAGKTTTLRMLCTLIKPTSGDAFVNEISVTQNPEKVRNYIGYVSYETKVDAYLTPREIARFFGQIAEIEKDKIESRIDHFSKMLDMNHFLDKQTRFLSTGMKQKTTILRALITDPQIIIFDEPTSGLDILTAKKITDYLKLLKENGKTIIFSTHILWESEKLSDKIGIINKGQLVAEGNLNSLRNRFNKDDLEDIFFEVHNDDEEKKLN